MTSKLAADVQAISGQWSEGLSLASLMRSQLESVADEPNVDLVAIGKASREMAATAEGVLGARVKRRLIVCDAESASLGEPDGAVRVGDHPVPGEASVGAARDLVDFLDDADATDLTLFLVSGGTSSLCCQPEPPLAVADLQGLWDAALRSGIDITTLNRIRAASSSIAGGAVLRHVRSRESLSLIMVDNVLSGAPWVGSGLTYEFDPPRDEVESLVGAVGLEGTALGAKLLQAFANRRSTMARPVTVRHENRVLASPEMLLAEAVKEASRRGYHVINMGSRIHGDVQHACHEWANVLTHVSKVKGNHCVIGVGELTVQVHGQGLGGRCQEFAWSMAGFLDHFGRDAAFAARASDGRDYLRGVGGAWVDTSTKRRAHAVGIDWLHLKQENDSYRGLLAVDQLLPGGHTGWNLCDIYVAVL